jgi:hypothetical protein
MDMTPVRFQHGKKLSVSMRNMGELFEAHTGP